MKRFISALFATLAIVAGTVSLASCGDDDKEDEGGKTPETGVVTVYLGTTDDMLGIVSVPCEIKSESGQTVSRTLTSADFAVDKELESESARLPHQYVGKFCKLQIPVSSLPFQFKVTTTWNCNQSAMTADKYTMGIYFSATFKSTGSSKMYFTKESLMSAIGVKKEGVPTLLQEYSNICTRTFMVNKKGLVGIVE